MSSNTVLYNDPNPTITINTNNYKIPGNTYLAVIYTGSIGNIFLPISEDCINGQNLSILNNGTGVLTVQSQNLDIIESSTGPVLSFTVNINETVNLVCDSVNNIWTILFKNSGSASNVFTTLTTENIYGNPTLNILTNINVPDIITNPIAIGFQAGNVAQSSQAIAIGYQVGLNNQKEAIAIGKESGRNNQDNYAIAIGREVGFNNQGPKAIAIGYRAGYSNQKDGAISVGNMSLDTTNIPINQGENSIAIGRSNPMNSQGANSISFSTATGVIYTQRENSIAIGNNSGFNQNSNSVAIGIGVGSNQSEYSVSVSSNNTSSGSLYGINIGRQSGINAQAYTVGIGNNVQSNAEQYSIGLGTSILRQNEYSIAIGSNIGSTTTTNIGIDSVAMGYSIYTNNTFTPNACVHIGDGAGRYNAGIGSIGIGFQAGAPGLTTSQGNYSIYLGRNAMPPTLSQPNNTVMLANVDTNNQPTPLYTNSFNMRSLRSNASGAANMGYDNSTGELYYVDTSDIRIKKNVEILADNTCLDILKNLEVKKYNYIDNRKPDKVYGFMAQEVENYIPIAVNKIEYYLPTINKDSYGIVLADKKLKVYINTSDLLINEMLKINNKDTGDIYEVIIESITNEYFITHSLINLYPPVDTNINLFICGKKINDMRTLRKDYLWAVKWGAIRELINKVKAIEKKIISLNL